MSEVWFASLLTPVGMSAIAVVGVRGTAAPGNLASRLTLRRDKRLVQFSPGEIAVADFAHDENGATEEVVIVRTSSDSVEIQCHGGRFAAESILRAIQSLGGMIISAREWALQNEKCPIRGEALMALSQARAPEPTRILLDQFHGALGREIEQAFEELTQTDSVSAHARLVELVGRSRIGLRLTSGFRVALLGHPNVGKSSLLNALLGFGRAIVLDEPGTTRDVLAAQAAFGGWPVILEDLAGVRQSDDPIEAEGVRRARQSAKQADLVLLIADASQPWADADSDLLCEFRDALVVHNKSDLPADSSRRPAGIFISARSGEGLSELQSEVLQRLIVPKIAPGAAVPFTESQVKSLARAAGFARSGQFEKAKQELRELLSTALGNGD